MGGFHVRLFAIECNKVLVWFVIKRMQGERWGLWWWVWLDGIQQFWLTTARSLLWRFSLAREVAKVWAKGVSSVAANLLQVRRSYSWEEKKKQKNPHFSEQEEINPGVKDSAWRLLLSSPQELPKEVIGKAVLPSVGWQRKQWVRWRVPEERFISPWKRNRAALPEITPGWEPESSESSSQRTLGWRNTARQGEGSTGPAAGLAQEEDRRCQVCHRARLTPNP